MHFMQKRGGKRVKLKHLYHQRFKTITLFQGMAFYLVVCLHHGNGDALLVHSQLCTANA